MPDAVERVADTRCETGENPYWHPDDACLYWTDIPAGRLYRYHPSTGEHEQIYDGPVVGGFTVQSDGRLLLFRAAGEVVAWDPDGGETTVVDGIDRERESRFNDVVADPGGRVFAGTMATDEQAGRLYRLDADGEIEPVVEGVGIPNGMGFDADAESFYFTDSEAGTVSRYDYDVGTGAISGPETVVEIPDDEGVPDGLAVDAADHLWSARWGGGCVVRYAPDGTEVERVSLPADRVSSVAFGGPDRETAYVTTAGGDDRATYGEGAGALFRFDAGVAGGDVYRSRVAANGQDT